MMSTPEFPREVCNEFGNDSKSGRLQRKKGAGTADGGQLFQSKHGSEAGDGGEVTHEMGRTEEKKQRCAPPPPRVPSRSMRLIWK